MQARTDKMIIFGVIAMLFVALAVFTPNLSITGRAVFAGIGLVMGIAWILMIWLFMNQIVTFRIQALAATEIKKMEIISRSNDKQLESMKIHALRVEVEVTPQGVEYWYSTPNGQSYAKEDIAEMTAYCLSWPKFPELPTQHGYSGFPGEERDWRDLLRDYTALVVYGGLAEAAAGNQPAKWRVARNDILKLLDVNTKEM